MSAADPDLTFVGALEESAKAEARALLMDVATWIAVEVGVATRPLEEAPLPAPGGGFLHAMTLHEAEARADNLVARLRGKREDAQEARARRRALALGAATRVLAAALEAIARGAPTA